MLGLAGAEVVHDALTMLARGIAELATVGLTGHGEELHSIHQGSFAT